MYKEFYFMIEGDDDERFVNRIVRPVLESNYDYIGFYQYAQRPKKDIERFIRSLLSKQADFLCLADINSLPCVTAKKQHIKEHKIGAVDDNRIIVIKMEIESWYLAGLNEKCCKGLRIPICATTDTIDKKKFGQLLLGSKLGYTINCMIEMLNNYDLNMAKSKNNTFKYFYNKHLR
jgi:hypothetical protein